MFGDLTPEFLHLPPALANKYSKFLSQFKLHDIVKRLHEAEAFLLEAEALWGCFSSETLLWYSSYAPTQNCIIMPQTHSQFFLLYRIFLKVDLSRFWICYRV